MLLGSSSSSSTLEGFRSLFSTEPLSLPNSPFSRYKRRLWQPSRKNVLRAAAVIIFPFDNLFQTFPPFFKACSEFRHLSREKERFIKRAKMTGLSFSRCNFFILRKTSDSVTHTRFRPVVLGTRNSWSEHLLPSQTCRINSCYRKEVPKKPKLPRWGFEERNLEAHFHPEQFNHCKKIKKQTVKVHETTFWHAPVFFSTVTKSALEVFFLSQRLAHSRQKSSRFSGKMDPSHAISQLFIRRKIEFGTSHLFAIYLAEECDSLRLETKALFASILFCVPLKLRPNSFLSSFPLFISLEFNCQPRHPTKCIPPKAFSGWKLRLFPRLKVEWKNGL